MPLYTSADYYYFIKILEDLGTIIKNEPEPVSAESFDDYQGSAGEKEFGMVISPSNSIENSFADKTVTDNKYRFYQSDVVADPSPSSSSDKALLVTTYAGDGDDYATNPLYTFIGVSNSYFMGDCYKFSADIMVKNGTSSFMQLLFSRAMGAAYDSFGLDFQMYEENGERFVRIADYKAGPDGDTDNNIADGIPLGTWFNVSVEVYKIYTEDENEKRTLNIVGKIYVNGKYVGISTSSRVENGAVVDIAMGAVTLVHSRRSNNEIYIDNVKAERTSDTYIAENPLFPVAPEDVPELLPEIEGTHTGGELYNNTESEGKRYGYDNGEKAPGTSKKQDAKAYISPDAFVYYYRLGNENGSHEYVTYSYNSVPEGYSSPIAVLEADIALGNANANNFLVFKFYGGGMRAGLYLNASADGDKIEFRNTVYSTDGAILLPNTWYSLRIEVYNLDSDTVRFKIYINGAFVAEADGLDVSENTKSRVEIQLQYTDADSWIAYDNIYLGYTDTEYVAPPVTEEPPAEGSGSEGGNEEGDGSEGGESVGTSGPLLSGTKGSGAYFNDGSKEGTRSDYEADSAKAPSTSSPDVSELTDGNYVWFHKGGTATKSITYSFGSVPSDRIANVIEFDAAFGNIANSKTFLRILLQGGVCRADMYLKTDASGFVTIGGDSIVSGENISVSQGEWHNYRLEYSLDESDTTLVNVKLFVDNVWQCDMQFACGTVGKERVLFYLQGDVDYFMCIDNVYVGYSSQPFVSGAQ